MEGKTSSQKISYRPKKVRVRDKGQITIPHEFRRKFRIEEDTVMDVYQLGEVIIVSPEKLAVKELAGAITSGMKERDISLDDLLAELREGSHEYKKEE